MKVVQQLVLDMKEAGVDYEFYPTSPRILDVVKRDMGELPTDAASRRSMGFCNLVFDD
jgi:hypothetical protein